MRKTIHNGPATIEYDGGTTPVNARVWHDASRPLKDWGGDLAATSPGSLFDLAGKSTTIRFAEMAGNALIVNVQVGSTRETGTFLGSGAIEGLDD